MRYNMMAPLEPFDQRVMGRLLPPDERGCRVWPGAKCKGYGQLAARLPSDPNRRRTLRVARLVVSWREGVDIEDRSWETRHDCDNPACCEPTHLRSGTPQQNGGDKVSRGRGNGRGRYRLSEAEVAHIRDARKAGVPRRVLADKYGVHVEHITAICSRRFWSHV